MALKEQVPNIYSVGLQNVGSYQVAGIPWITGSETLFTGSQHHIEFPYVTKRVTIINHSTGSSGKEIRVHFNHMSASVSGGDGDGYNGVYNGFHYISLDSDEDNIDMNIKVKEIYISAHSSSTLNQPHAREYRVVAELTNIPTSKMWTLTGSGLTD